MYTPTVLALLETIKLQDSTWTNEKQQLLNLGYLVYTVDWSLIPWTPPSYHDDLNKLEKDMAKMNIR
jgi:hypothetical protein